MSKSNLSDCKSDIKSIKHIFLNPKHVWEPRVMGLFALNEYELILYVLYKCCNKYDSCYLGFKVDNKCHSI